MFHLIRVLFNIQNFNRFFTDICNLFQVCPYSRIYPVRTAVVRGLGRALDDRKRAIRKLAAKVGQHNTTQHNTTQHNTPLYTCAYTHLWTYYKNKCTSLLQCDYKTSLFSITFFYFLLVGAQHLVGHGMSHGTL